VAAYYSNYPPDLVFELVNEPNGNATTAILNPIYEEAIRRIRLSNPGRTIFVGPSQWQSINELNNLQLPANDSNIVTSVHCYDPFLYTHQGATWAGPDPSTTGLIFPGPPASPLTPAPGISSWASNWIAQYNQLPAEGNPCSSLAFASKLDFARQWSDYYGRPVHVGEFGAFSTSEPNSRARFYTAFRSKCEEVGLGWAMWDWKAGFYYWNDATSQPATGLRNAMFPAVQLLSLGPGRFSFSSAIGKTYRIDIAGSLVPPVTWGPIATQTLTAPSWTFTDPAAIGSNRFYRAVWVK